MYEDPKFVLFLMVLERSEEKRVRLQIHRCRESLKKSLSRPDNTSSCQ